MAQSGQHLRIKRNFGYPRRLATWLAVLVLSAQVLVPFAQALAADDPQGLEYQLICTASGVKQILIGEDGAPIDAQDAAPCPFCLAYATSALLQPEDVSVLIEAQRADPMVFPQVSGIDHADTWRSASQPSRAPPQVI